MLRVNTKEYVVAIRRAITRVVCLAMVALAVWGGAAVPNAMAVGSQEAGSIAADRAAAELDRVAGAGTSDQLEGTVQGAVGDVKRGVSNLGDSLNADSLGQKVDGAADELAGKVKRDIGRTKSAAADLGDDVEDGAEGIVDSIKDFFE